jgi:hypothetical protein
MRIRMLSIFGGHYPTGADAGAAPSVYDGCGRALARSVLAAAAGVYTLPLLSST